MRPASSTILWLSSVAVVGALAGAPASGFAQGVGRAAQGGGAPVAAGGAAVAFGENGAGQLGAGFTDIQEASPVTVVEPTNVTALAAGYHFSVALLADGTVRSWGGNVFGQLGDGTRKDKQTPVAVSGLSGVTAISAGGAHALALLQDGTVMAWGSNQDGELGDGACGTEAATGKSGLMPVQVPGLNSVVAVAAGGGSNYALLADGTVMAWGKNNSGQLGIGELGPEECRTEVGTEPASVTPRPVVLSPVGSSPAVSSPAGGEPLSGVTAISAGSEAAYALLADGNVMAWGGNSRGALGNGTTANSDVPTQVKGLSHVVAVSGGSGHALALLEGGGVAAWGGNTHGQLGGASAGTCDKGSCSTTPQPVGGVGSATAISAGALGFSLVLSAGKIYAFGDNQFGQLGTGSAAEDSDVPTAVAGIGPVAGIAAGEQHSLALLQSGAATPPPLVSWTPGVRSLRIAWTYRAHEYALRYNPLGLRLFSKLVTRLESEPREYVFRGLSPRPYRVVIRSGAKLRTLTGTPLP